MKKWKKWLSLGLACTLVLTLFAGCSKSVPETIGTVNGKEISTNELLYYINSAVANVEQNMNQTYDQFKDVEVEGQTFTEYVKDTALDEAIKNRLIEQKFDELGLTFDEAGQTEVDEMITSLESQYGGSDKLDEALKKIGTDRETFKQIGVVSYKQMKIQEKLYGEGGDEEVTDQDVTDYYNDEYTQVKHILISTRDQDGNTLEDSMKQIKQQLANDLLAQIKAGADFDELMKSNTEDVDQEGNPNSPDGYIFDSDGNYIEPFKEKSLTMEIGSVEMVETDYGYHIIKRLDHKTNETFLAENFDTIKNKIITNKITAMLDVMLKNADKQIDDEAVKNIKITGSSKS